MKKLLVLGPYGAGKTKFSSELSESLNIPVFHLDRFFWLRDWETPSKEKWEAINKNITIQKEWIIDGNYIKTLDIRIIEADIIIYLDVNRWVAFYRVIRRTLLNLRKSRADLPDECKDKIDLRFFLSVLKFNDIIKPLIFKKIKINMAQNKLIVYNSNAKSFFINYLQSLKDCEN